MKSSLSQLRTFTYGTFSYEYELSRGQRATFSLTVTPESRILLKCPEQATDDRIERFLKKKWFWLERQLAFFSKFKRNRRVKEYISGESFLYLGRQYQLIVKRGKEDRVSLARGILMVETTSNVRNYIYTKRLVDRWYADRRRIVFKKILEKVKERFHYDFTPIVEIKPMEKRWGSAFRRKKMIVLNPRLIHASSECIEYVITHELCHFTERSHNVAFWKLLEKKFPNWKKVKEKLELRHG